MNTTYIARKITLPDAFKEKVDARLNKLDKFFDDAKAEVKVSAQKDTATVELTIRADGMVSARKIPTRIKWTRWTARSKR